jgi:hypothetical protein
MAVTMKNAVFWDVTPCGCCKNQRFEGTHRLCFQGENIQQTKSTLAVASDCSTLQRQLLATANVSLVCLMFSP